MQQFSTLDERCEQIRRNTMGVIARHLNKRISLPISRWIVTHTRWRPNQITYFNILVGFASGPIAALGTPVSLFFAAFILQVASILDGVDGEVAKLSGQCSRWGQWLDTLSDNGTLISYLVGTTIGLYRLYPNQPVLSMAVVTFAAFIIIVTTMLIFLRKETDSGSFVTYDQEFLDKLQPREFPLVAHLVGFLKYMLKKDFISFLFFAVTLIGQPLWVLYICSVGGTIACFFIAYIHISRWARRRAALHPTPEPNKVTEV